jgi:hypothetical protein
MALGDVSRAALTTTDYDAPVDATMQLISCVLACREFITGETSWDDQSTLPPTGLEGALSMEGNDLQKSSAIT